MIPPGPALEPRPATLTAQVQAQEAEVAAVVGPIASLPARRSRLPTGL